MPMATPTIEDSARGVSITRSSPNSCMKSAVTRNTPPRAPTSSPRISTRSSAFISSQSVSWTVLTRFFSVTSALLGEHVLHGRLRLGVGLVPRFLDGRVDLFLQLDSQRLDLVV